MQLVSSAVTVVGVIAMMLSISWILTLVALVIMPISLLFVTGLVKKSQKLFKEQQAYLGQVNGHVEEMYGGHLVIKAFNAEKRSIAVFEAYNAKLYGAAWSSQFISGLMMPLMSLVANLGYVVITVLGGSLRAQEGHYRGRHSGLHPVHQLLLPAPGADREHLERPAADGCGGRARLRVPGGGRGGRLNPKPPSKWKSRKAGSNSRTSASAIRPRS